MSLSRYARKWHSNIALALVLPLLMTVVTGAAYRICRKVFEFEKQSVRWLLDLHVLSIVGMEKLYPIILGVFCIGLLLSAMPLNLSSSKTFLNQISEGTFIRNFRRNNRRILHQIFGSLFAIPLLITSITGICFTIVKYYGTGDKVFMKKMMKWHQMSWLMSPVVWVSFIGVIGCITLFTGYLLFNCKRVCRSSKSKQGYKPVPNVES